MQIVRGLFRVFVVGFTTVSLMLVAAVAVSATSGMAGSSNSVKNSVVALFSGHPDQAVAHNATTSTSVTTSTNKGKDDGKDKHNGKDKEKDDDKCKPPKDHEGTEGREHHDCDTDHDSG